MPSTKGSQRSSPKASRVPASPDKGQGPQPEADETLESQVLPVVLPDGTVEVRLAGLDLQAGNLLLRQVDLDGNGAVALGSQAVIRLSSIAGGAAAEGKSLILRAGGPTGKKMLELRFESDAEALTWAQHITRHHKGYRAENATPERVQPVAHVETLRQLLEQQEEQVRLLERINDRKAEQLLQLQEQLQTALGTLQASQVAYAQQQKVVDAQRQVIQELTARLDVANSAEAACAENAATAVAGAVAAAEARRTGKPGNWPSLGSGVAAVSQTAAKALRHREEPQQSQSANPSATGTKHDDEMREELPDDEVSGLLARLNALEAQKQKFEELLQAEKGGIAGQYGQLQALRQMLGGMGAAVGGNDVQAAR